MTRDGLSDIIKVEDIRLALKSLMQAPKPKSFDLPLYPWEDRKYGDDFRARGYNVIVIGKIPS